MGFWRPRLIGEENYKKGQEMGAVSVEVLSNLRMVCKSDAPVLCMQLPLRPCC